MRPLYDEVDRKNLMKISPGIVDALERAPEGVQVRAKYLDSRYSNKKIGMALSILETAGDLKEIDTGEKMVSLYEVVADTLEPARHDSEEIYGRRIENSWKRITPRPEYVFEDIETRGIHISESHSGVETLTQFKEDYHQDTLEFLERLDVINDLDERRITADDIDIEYMTDNLERHVDNVLNPSINM